MVNLLSINLSKEWSHDKGLHGLLPPILILKVGPAECFCRSILFFRIIKPLREYWDCLYRWLLGKLNCHPHSSGVNLKFPFTLPLATLNSPPPFIETSLTYCPCHIIAWAKYLEISEMCQWRCRHRKIALMILTTVAYAIKKLNYLFSK